MLTDHLRAGERVGIGDVVRSPERDSLGTVVGVDADRYTATVHFASPGGTCADVDVPLEGLTVAVRHEAGVAEDVAGGGTAHDPWAAKLVEYLNTVEAARAERAVELADGAAGQTWTYLVPASLLADVAYYRDRWNVDDPTSALGAEPGEHQSDQQLQWTNLVARLGPVGTLAELAARRDSGIDGSDDATLVQAMARRRDAIVANVSKADRPPAWAQTMLRRTTWATTSPAAARQRELVGKAAVYRERFGVTGEGIGPVPRDDSQRRIWLRLRDLLRAPGLGDDPDIERGRHIEADHDAGLER